MPLKLRFLEQKPDAQIKALRQVVMDNAADNWKELKYGGFDPKGSEYGFADLRPTHVGLTNTTYKGDWTTPACTSPGAEETWFDVTVHRDSYVLIHGMFNRTSTPLITEGKFYLGGNDLAWFNMTELYGWDIARYYFEQGFAVSPDQTFKAVLQAKSTVTARAEFIGPLGEVLAKRSYVLKFNAPTP